MNDSSNRSGFIKIKNIANSIMELEFNIDATIEIARVLKGNKGAHRWIAYKDVDIPNKLKISLGDYVVVLGIPTKNKVHIEDPK
jgi:hypothetical protein